MSARENTFLLRADSLGFADPSGKRQRTLGLFLEATELGIPQRAVAR